MTAKRGRGRPKLHDVEPVRSQVSLPPTDDKHLRKLGKGSLSAGIVKASAFSKQAQKGRQHRLVVVTDPGEQAAIRRGDIGDPIGGLIGDVWYADAASLKAYRLTSNTVTEP